MRRRLSLLLVAVPLAACAVVTTRPQVPARPNVAPYRASGIYELGERAGWTVTRPEGSSLTKVGYTLRRNNHDLMRAGELDLSSGQATIEATMNEPAMLFLQLTPPGSPRMDFGAAVAPAKLQPVRPKPDDFDAFWARKIRELKAVPENAVVTPGESPSPDVDYATVQMDHVNGTHVYGQIAKPKRPGKYPAVLILQWASPPYPLQKSWVTGPASQGWLALNIEPHDVPVSAPPSYYQGLPASIKNYTSINPDDRERSYFVEMYLRDFRAAEYLAHHPDWDGKTLLVMGTSMGGQQSLAVAGLHPKITHLIVNVPAGCDLNASLYGRQMGYPNFPANNPKIMETARYVDCINFAPRIKATSLVAMGFVDTTSPPAGIWTAFNLIRGAKEAAPMVDSPHNNFATPEQQRPYTQRAAEWMNALVRGRKAPPPKTMPMAANRPVQRTDANSRIAHTQLVEKARRGRIDLYFLGDSITRRWGTSDAAYADFLANWKSNFYGWNAGNFGWGGDTTQNILWRLHNGELDGVNPKAIVLLAGTNNIGTAPGGPGKVDDVTRGVEAIVRLCQKKAPKATVVLTAIFPRNDGPVNPTIEAINRNLARLADGRRVRFVNVNHRLADASGKLLPGMSVDGLHLATPGYQVWADGLRPVLVELLGPPASVDYAPPPTGDPSATRATSGR